MFSIWHLFLRVKPWLKGDESLMQAKHKTSKVFMCSLNYKQEKWILKDPGVIFRGKKLNLNFKSLWRALKTNFSAVKCDRGSSVPLWAWWCAILQFLMVSVEGVPSFRLAATFSELHTCQSSWCERSSELQPWIISSRSKSLPFFPHSLQNQQPSLCNCFNTCKGMEYSTELSLCLSKKVCNTVL